MQDKSRRQHSRVQVNVAATGSRLPGFAYRGECDGHDAAGRRDGRALLPHRAQNRRLSAVGSVAVLEDPRDQEDVVVDGKADGEARRADRNEPVDAYAQNELAASAIEATLVDEYMHECRSRNAAAAETVRSSTAQSKHRRVGLLQV